MGRWLRRAVAGVLVAAGSFVFSSFSVLATTACDGHECDPSYTAHGCVSTAAARSDPSCCFGRMTPDGTRWQTSAQGADWVSLPPQGTVRLDLRGFTGDRTPDLGSLTFWVAPAPPLGPDAPFDADAGPDAAFYVTTASGNLGYVTVGPGYIQASNGTCVDQRMFIETGFLPPEGGKLGAGDFGPCYRAELGDAGTD